MDDHTPPAARPAREAAARFGRPAAPGRGSVSDAAGLDPALSQSLAAVMDRVAGVLEGQAVYRREIAALRDEAAGLRAALERAAGERRQALEALGLHRDRAAALEAEARALRAENARLEEYVRRRIEQDNPLHARPGDAFLDLPLVIRSGRGEFLGVAGRQRGPFSTRALLALMRSSQRAGRDVRLGWDRDGEHWALRAAVRDEEREQNLVFLLDETVTPSGNRVARLAHMIVDGNEAPDGVLVSLFRQIKDSFDA
jgi:hypothetical protein